MARPTQWLPAILDYMKKVRSNISTTVDMETSLLKYNPLHVLQWLLNQLGGGTAAAAGHVSVSPATVTVCVKLEMQRCGIITDMWS